MKDIFKKRFEISEEILAELNSYKPEIKEEQEEIITLSERLSAIEDALFDILGGAE